MQWSTQNKTCVQVGLARKPNSNNDSVKTVMVNPKIFPCYIFNC